MSTPERLPPVDRWVTEDPCLLCRGSGYDPNQEDAGYEGACHRCDGNGRIEERGDEERRL